MHKCKELPDYGFEKFFADVGGAAGLVLGMSVATLAGFDLSISQKLSLILYQNKLC